MLFLGLLDLVGCFEGLVGYYLVGLAGVDLFCVVCVLLDLLEDGLGVVGGVLEYLGEGFALFGGEGADGDVVVCDGAACVFAGLGFFFDGEVVEVLFLDSPLECFGEGFDGGGFLCHGCCFCVGVG